MLRFWFIFFIPLVGRGADLSPRELMFFESKVRPVLVEKCYSCHSLSGKSKGGLLLDTKVGWEKGGDSGPALVAGRPEQSLLVKAIRHGDPDLQMPKEKLRAEEIVILEQWVQMGAPDPRVGDSGAAQTGGGLTEAMVAKAREHWSFQAVGVPALPVVRRTAWPQQPLDFFTLDGMEKSGLTPSDAADRRTLIRRATLGLIGLPPTPEEVLAFVEDSAPHAFEKVVDRLLASPRYGERWGRHWLDVARYADTRGNTRNGETPLSPHAWTYRDYVIRALNADVPFDRFIKEQVAADLLGGAPQDPALAGLGFLTQGNQFGGQRLDVINDQIDVVTRGFLGLTVSCARCHDHMADPITQRDYYALAGVFGSSHEPDDKPTVSQGGSSAESKDYERQRAAIETTGRVALANALDGLNEAFAQNVPFFLKLTSMNRRSAEYVAEVEKGPADRRLSNELSAHLTRIQGRNAKIQANVNPVLTFYFRLQRIPAEAWAQQSAALLRALAADVQGLESNRLLRETFKGQRPASIDEVRSLYAALYSKVSAAYNKDVGVWRAAGGEGIYPGLPDASMEEVRTAAYSRHLFLDAPLSFVVNLPRGAQQLLNRTIADLARLDVSHPASPGLANVLKDDAKPRDARVLIRGQAQNQGAEVPRGFLEMLSGEGSARAFPRQVSGRRELAEAIASPQNPLTARVMVNRVWQGHFGEGLVATPDDFGTNTPRPAHADLLDYLAGTFMAEGWSLKKLHRSILLSRTWQQSSEPTVANAKLDPFNKLLSHMNVRKLDFEALRDSILFMGGRLDTTMGGRPVNIETEPYSHRRSVYGFIDRINTAEFMRNFDVASPAASTGKRHTTIVPQQALFRMNSLLVTEQARRIVDRPEVQEARHEEERLRQLYEIIFQRWPKPDEMKLALQFVRAAPEAGAVPFSFDPTAPLKTEAEIKKMSTDDRKLYQQALLAKTRPQVGRNADMMDRGNASIKEAVRDPAAQVVDRTPLAAWEKLAHALLMTNEVGYVN